MRPLKKVGGPMAKTLHDFYETLMPIKKVFFIWVEFLKRVFRAEISISGKDLQSRTAELLVKSIIWKINELMTQVGLCCDLHSLIITSSR